ncbi:MAG: histidinol-phosphatase [bacterium]|nr:histidinol-phosphatase [bacterium]
MGLMEIADLPNYHNHTTLCGHATGTIDEYIEAAIEKGFAKIGFSDHAPIPLPMREGISMAPEEAEFYITEIENRKEIYKDRIQVKTGFEIDFPLFPTFDKKYFTDPRIDFLIGSCHFIGDWPFDMAERADEFDKRGIDRAYTEYYTLLEELVDSKLFDIVGHFDLIKKFGHRPTKDFTPTIERICKKMSSCGAVAEINTSGLIKPVKEVYPSDAIMQIFFETNVPVTLGSDSHAPKYVGYMLPEMVEKLKKIGYRKISGFSKRKRCDIAI